jgi:prepilin-type N-terminal cleavage/methylation domain-containing protein
MTMRTRSPRWRRAFTLVEVMLAMALIATMVGLTWGTVAQSFRLRQASLERFDRYRGVQTALDRMSREIAMAFMTNVGQVATNDQNEITYRTAFIGSDDELTFTSLAHVRTRVGEVASEQCELSYRIESQRGEDGEIHRNLVRREDAPIDDDPEEGGVNYVLLHDVEEITFEYWDADEEIGGDAWRRSWDALDEHAGQLPSRVRITVEVAHPTRRGDTLTFTTQTQLALTKPLVILPANIAAQLNQVREELEQQQLLQDQAAIQNAVDAALQGGR